MFFTGEGPIGGFPGGVSGMPWAGSPERSGEMQRGNEPTLELIFPLGEEFVRSLLEQYQESLGVIGKGSMRYFQWLNGWPESGDRKEIDGVAKAFQTAEVLKPILIALGQESALQK